VAAEWHPARNGDLTPFDFRVASEHQAWWLCGACGHEWASQIGNRTTKTGCPPCAKTAISKDERHLAHELSTVLPVDLGLTHLPGLPRYHRDVDICAPSLLMVIEYDGSFWHKDRVEQDMRKSLILSEAGWTVLRVREDPLPDLDGIWCVRGWSGRYKRTAEAVMSALSDRDLLAEQEALRYASEPALRRATEALAEVRQARQQRAASRTVTVGSGLAEPLGSALT
jgi:hypothetical protein